MKRTLSLIMVLAIIMTMGINLQVRAESQAGWYLVDINFKDGTRSGTSSIMASREKLIDEYTYTGKRGDIVVTHSRHYYNPDTKTKGKLVASITTNQKWTDPQSFVGAGENIRINAESKLVSSGGSWNEPDDFSIVGPLSWNKMKNPDGNYYISKGGKASFTTEEPMKEGRVGDSVEIEVRLAGCYKYVYTYEWRETPPSQPAVPPAIDYIPDLTGEWKMVGNGHKAVLNITNQTGSEFTGSIKYKGSDEDKLTNGSIEGNKIIFDREIANKKLTQTHRGTLRIRDGSMIMKGAFIPGGVYSWEAKKEAPVEKPVTPPVQRPGNSAESFESGSRIMWNPAKGLGYRLFRSTSSTELGISVTDFYITSTSYADVNVEPNTTYYYTVKPVLAEARPFEGIDEKLGDAIATYVVKTGDEIYKPGSFKHFIMLKLESPNMSVDGIEQEVDPGRGTTPLVISGRTMVPIRAIVEAMGGTAEWDGNIKKITLKARGNTVEMWLGKKDIKVNGESKRMDVAVAAKNNRTFVPVRFAAENLDCKVDWINSTKEVVIVYEE